MLLESHSATTDMMEMKPARCWMTNIHPWQTVRDKLILACSHNQTQNTFTRVYLSIKKVFWCLMFVCDVSSHQLNQTHRAASQFATTQVNTTSPGKAPTRNSKTTPAWSTASSISFITSKETKRYTKRITHTFWEIVLVCWRSVCGSLGLIITGALWFYLLNLILYSVTWTTTLFSPLSQEVWPKLTSIISQNSEILK